MGNLTPLIAASREDACDPRWRSAPWGTGGGTRGGWFGAVWGGAVHQMLLMEV